MKLAHQSANSFLVSQAPAGALQGQLRDVRHGLSLPAAIVGAAEPNLAQAAFLRGDDLIQSSEICQPQLGVFQQSQHSHLVLQDVAALGRRDDRLIKRKAQNLMNVLPPVVLALEPADTELFRFPLLH